METVRGRPGIVFGIALIVLGALVLLARWAGWTESLTEQNVWPLFIIVPGVVLYLLAFVVIPPRGVGFAIAGSIVTILGIVLWAQQSLDRYDSWAYAWTLVGPVGAGFGLLLYGLVTRTGELIGTGLRVGLIGLGLFVVGMWYFEPILTEGRQPVDLETWWPLILVAIGVLVVVAGFRRTPGGQGAQHA